VLKFKLIVILDSTLIIRNFLPFGFHRSAFIVSLTSRSKSGLFPQHITPLLTFAKLAYNATVERVIAREELP
jgi:hypothetical protein